MNEEIRLVRLRSLLRNNGKILDNDDAMVADCGLTGNSVIRVIDIFRADIIIKTTNGRIIVIETRLNEKIIDLKKKIREKIKYGEFEFRLVYGGTFLMDETKRMNECGICDGSIVNVVDILVCTMQISVETATMRRVPITLSFNDRIIDIKKNIHEKIGVSPGCQLELIYEDRILYNDDETVYSCQITDENVINVVPRLRGIQIFAKTWDRKIIALYVMNNYRIIDIKNIIHEKIGLSRDEHRLVYQGGLLEDDNIVDHYQIGEGSVINVVPRLRDGMKIFAKTMDGKTISFEVTKNDRIIDIKKKIQEMTGLSPDGQQLVYQGGILYDDYKTVDDYEIVERSTINVITRTICDIRISVTTMNDEILTLKVTNFDRIIDIKKMIEEKIGLPRDEQIITVKGKIVRDDNARLYNYDITKNCIIDVSRGLKINITILTHTMETFPMEVMNSDRIIDIKKKIHDKLRLPPNEQRLEYCGELLDDEYGIGGNSAVTIPKGQKIRGICLVISNKNFMGRHKPRNGTEADVDNIKSTFEPMGYEIKIHRDIKYADMNTIIEETKKFVERSHTMLIVFILSHGTEKAIFTIDNKEMPFKDIWKPFTNDNFREFTGKPKLFFFVCCRGDQTNKAVDVVRDPDEEYDGYDVARGRYPMMADLFIGYATCKTYVACRTPATGTYYVATLCKVIRDHREWSVSEIHQKVQSILSKRLIEKNDSFQMPYYKNLLTDAAFFMNK